MRGGKKSEFFSLCFIEKSISSYSKNGVETSYITVSSNILKVTQKDFDPHLSEVIFTSFFTRAIFPSFIVFIPILLFLISNPKSIFGQTCVKKRKLVRFTWKLAHVVSRDDDLYSDISFLKFQA